jgi:hypothetical protein
MQKRVLLLLINLLPFAAVAQNSALVKLHFIPVEQEKILVQENGVYSLKTVPGNIAIHTLRFYISGIELWADGKKIWAETNSYHLVDAIEPDLESITLNVPATIHFNQCHFNLGIDSVTNAAGAAGGDLDATKGMYWAWQSGYINLKLEGSSPLCPTRKQAFRFHLGGFREETYCMQQITLPANGNELMIGINLNRFFEQTDLTTQSEVMIPGAQAVILSQRAATMFQIITRQP